VNFTAILPVQFVYDRIQFIWLDLPLTTTDINGFHCN